MIEFLNLNVDIQQYRIITSISYYVILQHSGFAGQLVGCRMHCINTEQSLTTMMS